MSVAILMFMRLSFCVYEVETHCFIVVRGEIMEIVMVQAKSLQT